RSARLFGNPRLVIASGCRPDPAASESAVWAKRLHRSGEVGSRLDLELADGRQCFLGKLVDRSAEPQLPCRRNPAAVVGAVIYHPASHRPLLVLVIDVPGLVASHLVAEAASEQRRAPCRAVPPGECSRPETHGEAP